MTRAHSSAVLALLAALLATLVLGLLSAVTPATAAAPTSRVVRDGADRDVADRHDLLRVKILSAVRGKRDARVRLVTKKKPRGGDAFSIWFDLDRDAKPDALLSAYAESEWFVHKARGWNRTGKEITGNGCFALRQIRRGFEVRVDPHCFARPASFRVSTVGFGYDEDGVTDVDWVPGRKTWSPRVRSLRPWR